MPLMNCRVPSPGQPRDVNCSKTWPEWPQVLWQAPSWPDAALLPLAQPTSLPVVPSAALQASTVPPPISAAKQDSMFAVQFAVLSITFAKMVHAL